MLQAGGRGGTAHMVHTVGRREWGWLPCACHGRGAQGRGWTACTADSQENGESGCPCCANSRGVLDSSRGERCLPAHTACGLRSVVPIACSPWVYGPRLPRSWTALIWYLAKVIFTSFPKLEEGHHMPESFFNISPNYSSGLIKGITKKRNQKERKKKKIKQTLTCSCPRRKSNWLSMIYSE